VTAAASRPHFSRIVLVFLIIVTFVVAVIVVMSVSQSPVVASQLNYNVHMNVNGIEVNGWTVDKCPTTTANGTGPWVCSIVTNGVIQNNSLRFLTGQVVQVNLWFEYLKKPVDPATITLTSVAAGSGFQIIKMEEPVPFSMSGWGSQSGLVLQLKVLPGQHSGSVDMSVRFSA
jgi:hypothetical protein